MTPRKQSLIAWIITGFALLGLVMPPVIAQTNVANAAIDLAGKILMVADSAIPRTVTNLFTFDRGAAVPFALGASSLKVTYLDADKLDGLDGASYATRTGTETLTNKTLTSPTINTPTITTPSISSPSFTGVLLGPLGAVGAPSYSFTGDANTGMWSAAADTLSLSTAGVKALEIDPTNFIDSATQPRAAALMSTTQSLSDGVEAAITFDTETFDVGALHSTSSNTSRFTIPTGGDGLYLMLGAVEFVANATGGRRAYWKKNGTTAIGSVDGHFGTVASATGATAIALAVLVATDYVELIGSQNSGGNLNTGSATTRSDQNNAQIVKLW